MALDVAKLFRQAPMGHDFNAMHWGGSIVGFQADLILIEKGWYEYFMSKTEHAPPEQEKRMWDGIIGFREYLPCRLSPGPIEPRIVETDIWHKLQEQNVCNR